MSEPYPPQDYAAPAPVQPYPAPPPAAPIDAYALQDMAVKLAAIADLLDQRSQQAAQAAYDGTQHLAYGAQQLNYAAQNLGTQGQQMVDGVVGTVGAHARQAIDQATAQSLEQLRQQLKQVGESAVQSAKVIDEQAKGLKKAHKALVWKAGLGLIVGAALAFAGSGIFLWRSQQELKRTEFARDLLRATNSGAITRCGEQLCVKVGTKPKAIGPGGEYALLQE